MINLKIRINEQTLTLPVDTQFVPGIPEKDPVVMVTEITEPEELKYLERDEWNIEELNFLAKRMESFDKREQSQFDAAVSVFRPKTVEALINYTYNLPRFTLISDFSTPNAIGVSHILNRKQVMSFDEMASTDFAKIGKELLTHKQNQRFRWCRTAKCPDLAENAVHAGICRPPLQSPLHDHQDKSVLDDGGKRPLRPHARLMARRSEKSQPIPLCPLRHRGNRPRGL